MLGLYHRLRDDSQIGEGSLILFVDDGSKDKTWDIICELHRENPVFHGIRLSRNKGHQTAIFSGMTDSLRRLPRRHIISL